MDAVDARAGTSRERRLRLHRQVDAHLSFHEVYGGDSARLLADAPGYLALTAWADLQGVSKDDLEDDLARLFLSTGQHDHEYGGSPHPSR
ncbi:MAG: hypothetical protein ABIO70_34615 [Pseudomonadota bacterium]